jgi:hypothetical protein
MRKFGYSFLLAMMLFWLVPMDLSAQSPCNGDPLLCNRRFDEVCYLTTHNAFNYQGSFLFPNQTYDIANQMQNGVRALMLDVYWLSNRPVVYHGNSFLGNQPLSDLLADIKNFLDQNPNEVLSIIFECYITSAQMSDAFDQAGLLPYLHVQQVGQYWPTLDSMVSTGKRLVVFTDATDNQAYPWYHHVWDFAVETHYTAHSRSDFNCNYNRGNPTNGLFILNHFITHSALGYGLIDSASVINDSAYLHQRALDCWAATWHFPNFLTVDFYEQGHSRMVKDLLNGSPLVGLAQNPLPPQLITVAPNPNTGSFKLKFGQQPNSPIRIRITDTRGSLLFDKVVQQEPSGKAEVALQLPFLTAGVYQLEWQSGDARGTTKVVVLAQ